MVRDNNTPSGTGLWQGIAAIGLFFDNRKHGGEKTAKIYANGRHEIAARVVIHMTDKEGNDLSPKDYPPLDTVKGAVSFIDYDTEIDIDGEEYGWIVESDSSGFAEPLTNKGTLPPLDPRDDNITDSIATLTYFLSCEPDAEKKDFKLGLLFEFETDDGIQIRDPIYNSAKGELHIPNIELGAINEIKITPDMLFWDAEEVNKDQPDYPELTGKVSPDNLWRQYNFAIKLDCKPSEPDYEPSVLYRAALSEKTPYRPDNDPMTAYCFGEQRQGLYSFRGFLWPNNIYKEDDVLDPTAKPLGNSSSYPMDITGLPGKTCELQPQEGAIYVTLFCSFGWTANMANNHWPLGLIVYDQFGNSGEFLVDPEELPKAYIAGGGMKDWTCFTTGEYKKSDHGGEGEVYFRLKSTSTSNYLMYTKNADAGVLITMGALDSKSDELFRLYRADNNLGNDKLSYKITTHDYEDASLAPSVVRIGTGSTMVDTNVSWIFEPYWEKTSQLIFHPLKQGYMKQVPDSSIASLAGIYSVNSADDVEWQIEIDPSKNGTPDNGSGGSDKPYEHGATVERGSWVKVTDIKWQHAVTPNSEAAIFSNGNHQDEIIVSMTLADVKGERLPDTRSPTLDYVKNAVTVIDYITGEHLSRHQTATGWEFSYVKNEYDGALASVTIDFRPENLDTIQNGVAQFSLYVTSNSGREETRQLGLAINITDEAWGDSVTWLNMEDGDFQKPLYIKTLAPIVYTKKELNVNAREVAYTGQNDEGFDVNSNIYNYIRQWDYEVSIKTNLNSYCTTKMLKCIIDAEVYPAISSTQMYRLDNTIWTSSDSGIQGALRYGRQTWSPYSFVGLFWPVNMLNKYGKPFDAHVLPLTALIGGSIIYRGNDCFANVSLSYPAPRVDSLYFSVIGIFGCEKEFITGQSRNPINFTLYDNYGNSGRFHARPEALPQNYDRHYMAAWCPVSDGFYLNPSQTEFYQGTTMHIVDSIKEWPLSRGNMIADKKVGWKTDNYCFLSRKYDSVYFSSYWLLSTDNQLLIKDPYTAWVILTAANNHDPNFTTNVYMRPVWARQKVLLSYLGRDVYLETNTDHVADDGYADVVEGKYSLGNESFEFFTRFK